MAPQRLPATPPPSMNNGGSESEWEDSVLLTFNGELWGVPLGGGRASGLRHRPADVPPAPACCSDQLVFGGEHQISGSFGVAAFQLRYRRLPARLQPFGCLPSAVAPPYLCALDRRQTNQTATVGLSGALLQPRRGRCGWC